MVSLEDLSFGYRRGEPIIDGLDYAFDAGLMSGITGVSGRGKSTLLYLIGLLLTPWSGGIAIGAEERASELGEVRLGDSSVARRSMLRTRCNKIGRPCVARTTEGGL